MGNPTPLRPAPGPRSGQLLLAELDLGPGEGHSLARAEATLPSPALPRTGFLIPTEPLVSDGKSQSKPWGCEVVRFMERLGWLGAFFGKCTATGLPVLVLFLEEALKGI